MTTSLKHELRTPLNHIIGYSELLLDAAADRQESQFVADLQAIHAAGKRLLGMVNRLFDPHDAPRLGFAPIQNQSDLRAPLRVIIGHVEALQQQAVLTARADVLADLQKIAVAARTLLRLAEMLVASARDAAPRDVAAEPSTASPQFEASARAGTPSLTGALLVADDDAGNRDMLSRRLTRLGHGVATATNGREAIEMLQREPFDLLLLDIEMPEMNGYQVLEALKADPALRRVPVVILSASDDSDGVAHCIQMGAEDYLAKPFNPVFLQARLNACLEKKGLRDREQLHMRQLEAEQQKSERLLLNVLPPAIATRLKDGEPWIADSFPEATVLFADLVGFTALAARMAPAAVVERLNEIFTAFDEAVGMLGLEKIKTIGDAYMAVGGVPVPRPDHAEAVATLALQMQQEIARFNARSGTAINVRIGLHSGAVVAGIIGRHKFAYDLWGDTVNLASRMESHSLPDRIQVTDAVEQRLRGRFRFERRGPIDLKGIGHTLTYFLLGPA